MVCQPCTLSGLLPPFSLYDFNGKFTSFCLPFNVDPLTCPPAVIVKYLRSLYTEGAEYTTINLHRSAISKNHVGFEGQPAGTHPLVRQAVKAVFRLRPPLPKYKTTFDISILLNFLSALPPNNMLDLKMLSYKTLLLTIYATLSRVSSISRLGPDIEEHRDHVVLKLHSLEKQGRPGKVRGYITVERYNDDPQLCPAAALLQYKDQVCTVQNCLFVSYLTYFMFRFFPADLTCIPCS